MGNKLNLHDLDFADFLKAIDACKGDIFLETPEGDILNLKSKLSQMLGISNILKEGSRIDEAIIRCANPEDESILFRFNLYQEVPDENE